MCEAIWNKTITTKKSPKFNYVTTRVLIKFAKSQAACDVFILQHAYRKIQERQQRKLTENKFRNI